MTTHHVLSINEGTLSLTISEDDLLDIDSTELKSRATIITGKSCDIPVIVRKNLQSPGRAEGIRLDGRSLAYRQIGEVAERLVSGNVDWDEMKPKHNGNVMSIENAAQKFCEAVWNGGTRLIVIPPYLFPKKRGNGHKWEMSKQFRVVTERPMDGDTEEMVMPAIVPILQDWVHASHDYGKEEKWAVVSALAVDGRFGLDFAVVLGTVMGLNLDLMMQLPGDFERIEDIATRVYSITEGEELSKIDKYLQVAKIIEHGNRATIPFEFVKYENTYLYGIDFGSVVYQKIEMAKEVLSDDALHQALKQYGNLMTFCPLDAFRVRRARTKREENIFYNKDPKEIMKRIARFAEFNRTSGYIEPRETQEEFSE